MFRRGQSSRGSQEEFPWLNFPQIESVSTMRKWKKKLADIKKKEVYVPNRIDWEWLQTVRYEEELAPYLLREFQHGGESMICDGWSRVFRMQEPVYLELCLEFFSTVSFTGGVDLYHPASFTFCLGGEYHQCSVVDLACRLGIYDQPLVSTNLFRAFLATTHMVFPDGVTSTGWWHTIGNKVYIPKSAQEGSIRSPTHRLIHRLISSTINQRKDDDKVSNLDVFYLWSIITPGVFCNIPWCIASYLSAGAVKDRKTSRINGGMFVTRLANSFGLMNRGAWNLMTLIPTPPFNPILFRRARIIEDYGGGHYAIPNDDPVVGPEAPGRRVRSRRERDMEDEPPVIPVENEDVPMDWYNIEMRRMQDQMARGLNFSNQSHIRLFDHFNIPHIDGGNYPYIPSWDERISARHSGAGGSGANNDDEEDED